MHSINTFEVNYNQFIIFIITNKLIQLEYMFLKVLFIRRIENKNIKISINYGNNILS